LLAWLHEAQNDNHDKIVLAVLSKPCIRWHIHTTYLNAECFILSADARLLACSEKALLVLMSLDGTGMLRAGSGIKPCGKLRKPA